MSRQVMRSPLYEGMQSCIRQARLHAGRDAGAGHELQDALRAHVVPDLRARVQQRAVGVRVGRHAPQLHLSEARERRVRVAHLRKVPRITA